jgi:hypothetical protein
MIQAQFLTSFKEIYFNHSTQEKEIRTKEYYFQKNENKYFKKVIYVDHNGKATNDFWEIEEDKMLKKIKEIIFLKKKIKDF